MQIFNATFSSWSSENAKQLVDEYWATQGGEKEREQVIKQLHDGYKTTAATKEKKGKKEAAAAAPALAAEKEEPATESRKRKTGRGAAASSSPAATPATATNSRKKRAKLDGKFPLSGKWV